MDIKNLVSKAATLWLEHNKDDPTRRFGETSPLTDKEIEEFLDAATHREAELWQQIDSLLDELTRFYPLRAARLKRELKWLRKMAHKRDRPWGRK